MSLRSTSTCSQAWLQQQHYQPRMMNDSFEVHRSYWTGIIRAFPFLCFCLWTPSLPYLLKGTCFEANKGPGHWLNHLFRTHHLQGLVAMLTSFSHAPGAPVSGASIPAVRPTEVGQSSPPTPAIGPFCLTTSVHPPHLCSCAVFLAAPQACDYSLMPALGSKDGGGWVLCLKAANMKMLQHKCEIMEVRPSVVCRGNNKKQPNTGRAIMKERRRLRDKMKEIKLTDRPDITFNPF